MGSLGKYGSKIKKSKSEATEDKTLWYQGSKMSFKELKYCRCLLEQRANELQRYGKVRTNAYAVCAASVGGKDDSSASTNRRSKIVKAARQGTCTADLNLERLPTRFLYAYASLRSQTRKGKEFFGSLPSPTKFFQDPEHFRNTLLRAAFLYRKTEKQQQKKNVK